MSLLTRVHDLLDAENADIDSATCKFCFAEDYNGNGLLHDDDCIIIILRREIRMAQIPTIGRIVHYMHRDGSQCRPAIIVHTWSPGAEAAACQLQVFNDSDMVGQFNDHRPAVEWQTSVVPGTEPGQFHFHEDCPAPR